MDEYYALNGAAWRVSSYSSAGENTCVEVAPGPGAVGVRDTKDRGRGHLVVSCTVWASFIADVKGVRR